jgi:hypothetical protein
MVILASSRPVILIVEDDLLIRMNALETIGEAGFEVIEASDADEAIMTELSQIARCIHSASVSVTIAGRRTPRRIAVPIMRSQPKPFARSWNCPRANIVTDPHSASRRSHGVVRSRDRKSAQTSTYQQAIPKPRRAPHRSAAL